MQSAQHLYWKLLLPYRQCDEILSTPCICRIIYWYVTYNHEPFMSNVFCILIERKAANTHTPAIIKGAGCVIVRQIRVIMQSAMIIDVMKYCRNIMLLQLSISFYLVAFLCQRVARPLIYCAMWILLQMFFGILGSILHRHMCIL